MLVWYFCGLIGDFYSYPVSQHQPRATPLLSPLQLLIADRLPCERIVSNSYYGLYYYWGYANTIDISLDWLYYK